MLLAGKKVVFTGTLTTKRDQMIAAAKAKGAQVISALSAQTDILVAGRGAGSKMQKAIALGVTIWDESQFRKAAAVDGGMKRAASSIAAAPKADSKMKAKAEAEPKMKPKAKAAAGNCIAGKIFAFSMPLSNVGKMTAVVKAKGARITTNGGKANIIVACPSGPLMGNLFGTLDDMKAKGITVWDEPKFWAVVGK